MFHRRYPINSYLYNIYYFGRVSLFSDDFYHYISYYFCTVFLFYSQFIGGNLFHLKCIVWYLCEIYNHYNILF
jgi:hypothetical protein